MEFINDPNFWIGLLQIVWINIIPVSYTHLRAHET